MFLSPQFNYIIVYEELVYKNIPGDFQQTQKKRFASQNIYICLVKLTFFKNKFQTKTILVTYDTHDQRKEPIFVRFGICTFNTRIIVIDSFEECLIRSRLYVYK